MDIVVSILTEDTALRKLEKYNLKAKLGLFELFDEDSEITKEQLQNAGFTSYAEYEELRFKVLDMIDNNIEIPKDIVIKLIYINEQRK